MFRNPIIPGFNPDPSIIRVGTDYFLATSTFEFFPGIPIYHSTNLIDWKRIGHVLTRPSQLNLRTVESSGGVYAPTLRYHKGRFWVAVGAQHRRSFGLPKRHIVEMQGFHVHTDNIWDETSWSDPIHYDVTGIDQDLFWDDDDTCYLSYSATRHEPHFNMKVYTVPINPLSGDILSAPRFAMEADLSITKHDISEGPHIFKMDGRYYLITANGGTEEGHSEWIYRSDTGPMGPWTPGPTSAKEGEGQAINPMIYNADHTEIQCTGHMDMVEGADGRWWAVFLGVRPRWTEEAGKKGQPQQSQLGRETCIAPVEWQDGWPIVDKRQRIAINATEEVGVMAALPRSRETYKEEWHFSPDTNLALDGWYSLRTPLKPRDSLTQRPGALAIRGGPYGLEHDEAVSMFVQKQTAFEGVFAVTMELEEAPEEGHEAGVVVWWSKWAHAALCIRTAKSGEGREVVLKRPKQDDFLFEETALSLPLTACPSRFTFRIETTREGYTLHTTPDCQAAQPSDGAGLETIKHFVPVDLITRSTPQTSYFIGTHLGIYAAGGNGVASRQRAFFSGASWEGVREGGA